LLSSDRSKRVGIGLCICENRHSVRPLPAVVTPRNACRWLVRFALLTSAGIMLASCDTPVGVSPALRGTYWEHAIVTNPNGGRPMEVRWGVPDP